MEGNIQVFAILLIVSLPALIGWILQLRSMGSQSNWKSPNNPDPDAKIIDMKTQKVKYTKNNAQLMTTVTFSDGYYYISHLTDRENGFLTYTISLSPETKRAIIDNAVSAHKIAVQERLKKAAKHRKRLQTKAKKHGNEIEVGEIWQCASCGRINNGKKIKCFCGYSKEWSLQQQNRNE